MLGADDTAGPKRECVERRGSGDQNNTSRVTLFTCLSKRQEQSVHEPNIFQLYEPWLTALVFLVAASKGRVWGLALFEV